MASRCSGFSCLIALGAFAQPGWSDFREHRASVDFSARPSLEWSVPSFVARHEFGLNDVTVLGSADFATGETAERSGRLLNWSIADELDSNSRPGAAAAMTPFVDPGLPPPGNRGGGREIAPAGPSAGIFPVTIEPGFSRPAVPSITPTVVPSPGSALLGVLGLAAAVTARRRVSVA